MAKISVIISDELKNMLEEVAKQEDRNISYIVRKAIEEYLKQKEK